MRRWLLRILLVIALLLAVVVLSIALMTGTEPGSRWLLGRIAPLVGLEFSATEGALARTLTLTEVRYSLPGQTYRAERLTLAWRPTRLLFGVVDIAQLEAQGLTIAITTGAGAAGPEPAEPSWPSLALPVLIRAEQLAVLGFDLAINDQTYHVDELRAALDYGVFRARLTNLRVATAASEAGLSLTLGLQYPYNLEGELLWALALPGNDAATDDVSRLLPQRLLMPELAGSAKISGNIEALTLTPHVRAPIELSGELTWRTGWGKPVEPQQLSGRIRVPEVPLALLGVAGDSLAGGLLGGEVVAEGWLDAYTLATDVHLQLPEYETFTLAAEARGNTETLQIDEARLRALGAEFLAEGELDWRDGIAWQADLNGEGINPAQLIAHWPGQLQLDASSEGRYAAGQLTVTADINELAGQVRGHALSASGVLTGADSWQLADGYLAMGGNRLTLSGSWGETLSARWDLAAPLLSELDPALGGGLNSAGTVSGTLDNLQVAARAETEWLKVGAYSVQNLLLQTPETPVSLSNLEASLTTGELALPGLTLRESELSLAGGMARHQVEAKIVLATGHDLALAATGQWQNNVWQGEIERLRATTGYTRAVVLRDPVAITASAREARIEQFCLTDDLAPDDTSTPQSQICSSAEWSRQAGARGELQVGRLPLAIAQNWLKPDVTLAGYLAGDGHWNLAPGQDPSLSLALNAVDGALHYQFGEEDKNVYPLSRLMLTAELANQKLEARLDSLIEGYGTATASVSADTAARQFTAEALIDWQNLAPLEALLPEVHNVTGTVNASVKAEGSFKSPSVDVLAVLSDGSFYLPALGSRFNGVAGELRGDQSALKLSVKAATAEEGSLELAANASNLLADNWSFEADLTGTQAELMATPTLTLYVSPDINVKGSAENLYIRGIAEVPRARAVIKTLPVSATRVSDDVIVIDGAGELERGLGIPLHANITVKLGDDVTLNAAGLEARLGGQLRLTQEPSRPLYLLGQIDVIRGRFEAYGQDLTIERGALSFNGPADNPALDVTATRETEDYVAGIIIGGTLQNPTSEVFARPEVSQSDAMAILFTGKPLSETSSSDQSMLVGAVAKYGLNRGSSFLGGFSDDIGLDEITIKTDDAVEDSQLWLGKYLTPKLYVHYAIGLFEQISTVGLTYFINDNFRVEAESGEQQSADLIFKMER